MDFKALSIAIILSFAACSGSNNSDKTIEASVKEEKTENEYVGYLRVDLDMIMLYSKSVSIHNLDKSIYAEITGDTLSVNGVKYNLIEDRRDILKRHIDSYSFYPDYKVFILECDGVVSDFYKVRVKGGYKFIPIDNKHVKFETLEDFVLSSIPDVGNPSPLRKEPNDDSEILIGHEEFVYKSDKIQGDWLHVVCDIEYLECSPNLESGWVKWRDSTGLILRLAQTY
ncbi:hypothetical protein [Roseivirga pacifica]|uniref:hypothetical protein n=1 Tax=Roseivirga pacifica TaxID=1267423 RepID=UPI003BAFE1BB